MGNNIRPSERGIALVTGASSGIGEQIAIRLARRGYDLLLVARDARRLNGIAEELAREHHVETVPFVVDLAVPNAAQLIADRVSALGADVEILVNDAGYAVHGAFAETSPLAETTMLQVNVMALVELTKLFLPGMVERRRGRVLNVSSTAAFFSGPFMAAYYASKAFVLSFSEALAAELQRSGVTVTVVCPGPTMTRFATVAGVTETPLFRRASMSASDVADGAVTALFAGKRLAIIGFRNKLVAFSSRLAPRRTLTAITRRLNESR